MLSSFKWRKIFLLYFSLLSFSAFSQLENIPPNQDTAFLIESKVLHQPRSIWVHLPEGYSPSQSYPVLYLLDGDAHFKYVSQLTDYLSDYDRNRIPKIIVVGIVNIDRGKDLNIHYDLLNGKKDLSKISVSEGSGKFLKFIELEVVPQINSRFKTQPYRILMGHSLAGEFAFYTKNTLPGLFQAIILISPAIHDENSSLIGDFSKMLQRKDLKGKMYISLGDENTQKVNLITEQLRRFAPASFEWDFRHYKEEDHFSVTYKSMFDGLKFIYKNWFFDNYSSTLMTPEEIQQRFESLSKEFGYPIQPTEDFVNNRGYKQLRAGNIDIALNLFQQNVRNYPDSWNAYDSLGEVYMKKGDKKSAIENYKKSLQLNSDNADGKKILEQLQSGNKN
ncbi:alpha/beta hydrolase-fold protein [Chryseobacterium pennipullorum]|uniref:Alpha/beta hydrolase n=1 Tax=Chryseobacterium pennipullorum TaxID=2258963 RepID=A0A3D9APQ6_9FLAO|nr:alpha/beta hydrolase-fold protein [Chryseobacterium pennipullorum]REC43361.1 alpha/beta hydrolase [Chryseobacterium pennipullorum]